MRKELLNIDPRTRRGLEIGPLAAPVVRKEDGPVYYVDHTDARGLREKYAWDQGMAGRLDDIVEVDYVLQPRQSLSDAVKSGAPFDYVIASHLIEHIPDMVGWMAEIESLLAADGILSLVIPDKRYSFDINRSVTEISDVVDAHLRHLSRPSYGQIFDFFSKAINGVVDRAAVWAGTADYRGVVRADCDDPDVTAYQYCQDVLASDEFVDVHCHVFTPASFLDVFEKLVRLGLTNFEISSFTPTERDYLEFYVSLRLLPEGPDQDRRDQLASVIRAREVLQADEEIHRQASRPLGPPTVDMGVSELERRLIVAKRSGMGVVRSAIRRIRAAGP